MLTRSGDRLPSSELDALFRSIASGDVTRVTRMLSDFPRLVSEAASVGASRADARPFYLEQIEHYFYAGDTALHLAAAAHHADITRDLVQRGAPIRARNRRGAEPLHYACDGRLNSNHWSPSDQAAVVETLLETGADPSAIDRSGVAPLHRAVRSRCAAVVRTLLDRGANARQANGRGSTPLHLAVQTTGRGGSGSAEARRAQAEIVRALIAHGARATDRDAHGKTVAEAASSSWLAELVNES